MNGVHDMGGMHGVGPIDRDPTEPTFHSEWQKRIFAISRLCATQGLFNIDEGRHAIERMQPADYLSSSYYERWLARTLLLLAEKGLVTGGELEARIQALIQNPEKKLPRREDPLLTSRFLSSFHRHADYQRPGPPPRFTVGSVVITHNEHPLHHTRLPRYARGKQGAIHAVHGCFIFPDTNAHGNGEQAHPLYSVRFEARELWSNSAEGNAPVYIDLWERYLAPALSTSDPDSRSTS